MSENICWSRIVDLVRKTHKEKGGAACFLRPVEGQLPEVMVDLSRDGLVRIKGKELGKRTLGRLLFQFRNTRMVRRARAVIWTAYDSVSDESVVGFGAGTSQKAAFKLAKYIPNLTVEELVR